VLRCSFTIELFLQLQFNLLVEVGHVYLKRDVGINDPLQLFDNCVFAVLKSVQECSIIFILFEYVIYLNM